MWGLRWGLGHGLRWDWGQCLAQGFRTGIDVGPGTSLGQVSDGIQDKVLDGIGDGNGLGL